MGSWRQPAIEINSFGDRARFGFPVPGGTKNPNPAPSSVLETLCLPLFARAERARGKPNDSAYASLVLLDHRARRRGLPPPRRVIITGPMPTSSRQTCPLPASDLSPAKWSNDIKLVPQSVTSSVKIVPLPQQKPQATHCYIVFCAIPKHLPDIRTRYEERHIGGSTSACGFAAGNRRCALVPARWNGRLLPPLSVEGVWAGPPRGGCLRSNPPKTHGRLATGPSHEGYARHCRVRANWGGPPAPDPMGSMCGLRITTNARVDMPLSF